jgi:hypothetical protein
MKNIPLYKFQRKDGGITVSPNKPDCEYTTSYRLIADEGMTLTNDDEHFYSVIDTDSIEGWREIEEPDVKFNYKNDNG